MKQNLDCYRMIITGLFAFLLVAGISPAMAADGTSANPPVGATITVITFPGEAAVSLNGEYRGVTPIEFERLPPGRYQIDVSKAGYRNETIRRTLNEGSSLEIGINLELLSSLPAPTGSGSIAVDSRPGGASVLLDGNPAGMTPAGRAALILNTVPIGNHTVTVELAGYPMYTSTVTVIKNQVVKVSADLVTTGPTPSDIPNILTEQKGESLNTTTEHQEPVPLSPLTAIAAAGLAGLAVLLRRS